MQDTRHPVSTPPTVNRAHHLAFGGLRPDLAAFFALAAHQSRHSAIGEQRGILAELLRHGETD